MGGDEVDRGAGALDVRQQLLDPAGRRGGRPTDPQPRVDRLHGVRGDVVEPQVLLRRARPEDLEVGLVPDLEGPVLDHLVAAVPLHEVCDQVVDQVVPAAPVLGRRDDRAVVEHRLAGVRGEVVRHERQLHDRVEPQAAQVVVDPVHSREVVDRVSAPPPGRHRGRRTRIACARTWVTPSSSCAARSAAVSSAPIGRPPVVSSESVWERCSLPTIGRHGRGSGRTSVLASTSTRTGSEPARRARSTRRACCADPRRGRRTSVATAYQRGTPGVPVVSAYGGCGTASTSRPAWSSGSNVPSAASAAYTW